MAFKAKKPKKKININLKGLAPTMPKLMPAAPGATMAPRPPMRFKL